MAGENQPRITNADLALMIGDMRGQIKSLLDFQYRLDKALNGNGKPGLISDHQALSEKVGNIDTTLCNHITEHKNEKEAVKNKKEKWDGRTWAITLAIIGAFISQTVGLIFLYFRTGGH